MNRCDVGKEIKTGKKRMAQVKYVKHVRPNMNIQMLKRVN
jgi:hypothetical protein